MENYSYTSYPESHDSSPRSRDNESWDDQQPPSSYKVKFMCSYGGKIHPRPNDNQLAYVGGETKIFAVDRNIRFSTMISKLSTLYSGDYNEVCFKYQLPGEDLDALISVTNDEDLEHMMLEYDRLYRSGGSRPARLRLFLFPLNSSNQSSFSADDPKPNQQWFVDALNSVTGQVGHGGQGGYYGMQRVVPDVYREQPVYSMGPPPGQPQMQQAQPQMQKMMMGETGAGVGGGGYTTTQIGYDTTGRQVYYTTTATGAPSGGVVPSSYPTAVTTMPVDPRQSGPLNQE
ncbi:Octicosapeptide/phox/Bem1p family protein, partial [Thalictrum thalictroides]